LIDLHTHTTASDGRLEPEALVREAWLAGLRVLSVTDHDTTAALPVAGDHAERFGLTFVPGIEITAIDAGDIHILGYFIEAENPPLQTFLERQRAARVVRVREIGRRLEALGKPIDTEAIVSHAAATGRSLGRPAVAAALVEAGHVASRREAFDQWLAHGRPAAVPRGGAPVDEVIAVIHEAGGLASLAHPLLLRRDGNIADWAGAGLDALEVYHSDHHPDDVARYRRIAEELGLDRTGGSDFHGDARFTRARLGLTTLPADDFERFRGRLAER
jgi:3',5'-nucleoside bisphosphate phosphatase